MNGFIKLNRLSIRICTLFITRSLYNLHCSCASCNALFQMDHIVINLDTLQDVSVNMIFFK